MVPLMSPPSPGPHPMVFIRTMMGQRGASDHKLPLWLRSARCGSYRGGDWDSLLVLSGFFRWAGALIPGGFTLFATFVANRFWETPLPKRYATKIPSLSISGLSEVSFWSPGTICSDDIGA
jgi:hypothetical protein